MLAERLIKAAAALAAAAFFVPVSSAQDGVLDPAALLPGYWGWDPEAVEAGAFGTCENSPMRIWFSDDGERYNSQWEGDESVATAPIIMRLPSSGASAGFLIRYDDEERLDPDGHPVEWLLLMTGSTQFVWIRRDWITTGGSTAPMLRCDDALIG